MKKLLFIAMVTLFSGTLFAQGEKYGKTPEDSVSCVQNISLYQEFFRQENYKDALVSWRNIIRICPKFSKGLYVNGAKMYKSFIKAEEDQVQKDLLVDTLMWIYDLRIEHFDSTPMASGKVEGRKGADLLKYKKKTHYEEAYNILKSSFEKTGDKMPAAAVASYYSAAYRMYANKKMEKGDLIALFPVLADICEKNIKAGEKSAKYYSSALDNIEKIFSKIAECPDLIELFTPKSDAAPDDLELHKTIVKLLTKKECTDSDLFLKAVNIIHDKEPSVQSSMGLGDMYIGRKDYEKAKGFYLQASELATDDPAQKEESLFKAAQSAYNLKRFSEVRTLCNKVLAVNPNNGNAIILIGDAYAASAKSCMTNDCDKGGGYWAAYDKYARAKSVDPSVSAKADKKMANAKGNFPGKQDCFFHGMNNGDSFTVGCWINETTTVRTRD